MSEQDHYVVKGGGETAFTVRTTPIKFGVGALAELGADARSLGMKRVVLFIERRIRSTEPAKKALASLGDAGIDFAVYDRCRIEPTDGSFLEAADFARDGRFDGYISLGGGSVMDTAKAANLLATHPADFLTYVNAPIGGGQPVPGPLAPHIACPTTCGTGSESTGAAVFDLVDQRVKTGISHPFLKPALAIIDPTTTYSLPEGVIASTGFDVLTHAIEAYTARPFTGRRLPSDPGQRPVYQGANPFSDLGSGEAMRIGGRCLVRAFSDAEDREARNALMFASTLAGMAFGNAGVHIPHAMSYAVGGLNHSYRARGYEKEKPMVPHGISVVLTAPAAFRFTGPGTPRRHLEAALALGADPAEVEAAGEEGAGNVLAETLLAMMKATGIPNGLAKIGFREADLAALAKNAWAQQRLLVNTPRPVDEAGLEDIFRAAMSYN